MTHRIIKKWNDKEVWFRDHAQASRVGEIILERLADDRVQEECRYLSRLRWHLFMGYQEVSYDELQLHVSQTKMAILDNLFALIVDSDYEGINQWTVQYEQALPIVWTSGVSRTQTWEKTKALSISIAERYRAGRYIC